MEMDHGIKEDNHGNAARIESSAKLAILVNSDFCASECRPLKEPAHSKSAAHSKGLNDPPGQVQLLLK